MIKIAVLISGGGTNLQAIIDAIQSKTIANASLSVVISNKEDAYGLERAKKAGVTGLVISPRAFSSRLEFEKALLAKLEEHRIDLIVLAGYLVIIPDSLVKRYKNRIINIHPSLIPSFCGAGAFGLNVHKMALERGVKITGATVHFVDEGTDTGPIILQQAVEVKEGDTPESLQKRVMEEAEWRILPKAIRLFCNGQIEVVGNQVFIKE